MKTKKNWLAEDGWSEIEVAWLLCGAEYGCGADNAPEASDVNNAAESIRRAVLFRDLAFTSPIDATDGDRLYGHHRFFKPADVVRWAQSRFPKFPFTLDRLPADPQPESQTERLSMLKMILGMAMDGYQYDPKKSKNAATGSNRGSIYAALESRGLKLDEGTIRKYLVEASELFVPKE